jgi:hypothetical protein
MWGHQAPVDDDFGRCLGSKEIFHRPSPQTILFPPGFRALSQLFYVRSFIHSFVLESDLARSRFTARVVGAHKLVKVLERKRVVREELLVMPIMLGDTDTCIEKESKIEQ